MKTTRAEQKRIGKQFNTERDRYLKWERGERILRVDGFRRKGGVRVTIDLSAPIELSAADVRKLVAKLRKWLPRKRRAKNSGRIVTNRLMDAVDRYHAAKDRADRTLAKLVEVQSAVEKRLT